jgi:hypothetical protein
MLPVNRYPDSINRMHPSRNPGYNSSEFGEVETSSASVESMAAHSTYRRSPRAQMLAVIFLDLVGPGQKVSSVKRPYDALDMKVV